MQKFWFFRLMGACVCAIALVGLVGCAPSVVQPLAPSANTQDLVSKSASRTGIDAPDVWGGEVRCSSALGCQLVAVEHEKSTVVLYQLRERQAHLLDRQKVGYHPDGAVWLTDDVLVAAVEDSNSLDVFRIVQGRLKRIQQITVNFSPRDVIVVGKDAEQFRLLATPYKGTSVAWVDYKIASTEPPVVKHSVWCEAPWHPVKVNRLPNNPSGGVVTTCLDDKRVVYVPNTDLMEPARTLLEIPAHGYIVPRQGRPSPSGKWFYVALETGDRNLRFNMDTGEYQWVAAPLPGAVAVLPLADDLVIWAADSRLYLQHLDDKGGVKETRWFKVDGFATGLQLQDTDADGHPDLIIYNSAVLPKKMGIEIIYGPLWENANKSKP